MSEKIDEEVSVSLIYDSERRKAQPWLIKWRGRVYKVSSVGLHHFSRVGNTLIHYFSVICGDTFFRLTFDTGNLHWRIEEIGDI